MIFHGTDVLNLKVFYNLQLSDSNSHNSILKTEFWSIDLIWFSSSLLSPERFVSLVKFLRTTGSVDRERVNAFIENVKTEQNASK